MDNVRPRASYSPIKRSYYTKPAFRPKNLKQDVKTFGVQNLTTAGTRAIVNTSKGKMDTNLKKSKWVWRPKGNYLDHVSKDSGSFMLKKVEYVDPKGILILLLSVQGNPEILLQDHAVVDSGCSSHITNFSKLIFGGMIRHLDVTKKFVMYLRFLQIFLSNQLKDVPVPLDQFPVPTLTKKVLTFMVKKGKNFLGKVTPLFESMLVQQIEDEGDTSERPSDSSPIPPPPHPSEDQPQTQSAPSPRSSPSIVVPDPEGSGENHRGQSSNDASLSGNEDGLTLQSVYDLCVSL
ncbi:hypothetical protein Tco_1179274, partial [Tanacetum coccineum]